MRFLSLTIIALLPSLTLAEEGRAHPPAKLMAKADQAAQEEDEVLSDVAASLGVTAVSAPVVEAAQPKVKVRILDKEAMKITGQEIEDEYWQLKPLENEKNKKDTTAANEQDELSKPSAVKVSPEEAQRAINDLYANPTKTSSAPATETSTLAHNQSSERPAAAQAPTPNDESSEYAE
jgi:hypothetical protein